MPWDKAGPLQAGQTFSLGPGRQSIDQARAAGLLDVDLSSEWVPFIFSESDGPGSEVKPNPYRQAFIGLADDRASPDEVFMDSAEGRYAVLTHAGLPGDRASAETPLGRRVLDEARRALRTQREPNFLEAYGIPPTLSVLLRRIDEDERRTCYQDVDNAGLAAFDGTVTFQSRDQARREYNEALADASWLDKQVANAKEAANADTTMPVAAQPEIPREEWLKRIAADDAKSAARIERYHRGQARLRAVRAVQARLICEGLLTPRAKHIPGMFDLATNEALAAWERKNDIFGWGFLGGETTAALLRPPLELHFATFRRVLMERLADAAGIIEDGSVSAGPNPATWVDPDGARNLVPDLLGEFTDALMSAMGVRSADDMVAMLRHWGQPGLATLHVAFKAPPLPPYYGPKMELSAVIDRGDVWYDFPFDEKGRPINQPRVHFPTLTLYVTWAKQKIPLCRWRTTIGSWRSEMQANGKIYLKYKNSDVGERVWKDIVAAPVWIPPEGTPAKDLLTHKSFDRSSGPEDVVNTDVMGPGFQSAYGLVLAIHHQKRGNSYFDNQIRTHGSVDYTSIARRFSHGCHRLVNSRAVRLFDFVLRHRAFVRKGNMALALRRHFTHEDKDYRFALGTRGYFYELTPPVPVVVTEGRIRGKVKRPVEAYLPKPGVDYGDDESDNMATSTP
jgi:hypothetical protein